MALGFLPAVIFAWVYEITPEGLKPVAQIPHGQSIRKRTGRRLDLAIICVLGAALLYFAVDKFWISKHLTRSEVAREGTQSPPPFGSGKSIAVLPFVDLTEKKDQQYFADGMAEEVIDLLARIPGLKVIGRTSSFQFRDKAVDTRLIGTTLGAAYVLEGSVRRSADAIRVTAQLIDTQDGSHRWSDTVDSKSDDILQVQDAIAAGIARALELTVQNAPTPRESTTNPAAYDLYLRGLHFLDRYTADGCEQAAAVFQQALELDHKFVPAEIGVARAYDFMGQNAWIPPKIAFERAREAANRALAIDPGSAAAHIRLANVHMIYDWNWAAADSEVAAAFKLGARDPEAFVVAAAVASVHGDWQKAIGLDRQALAQDPLNAQAYMGLGWYSYARMGRYAEAETAIKRALQIDPGEGSGHFFLAIITLVQGRTDDALKAANQETLDDGQLEASAAIYHAVNRKADSDVFLGRSIEHNADTWASAIAKVYAFRGESDKAMEWLNRAYDQRDEDLYFIAGDPLMRNLEHDPRYEEFLRRMDLPAK